MHRRRLSPREVSSLSDLRCVWEKEVIYIDNFFIDNEFALADISPDGRAAGLTDALNFILAVPVSSESLPRSTKPADGDQSLLKGLVP